MIKLLKYLKKSAVYILFIVLLLFLQAYCDLSLPDYTSRIVNVGIQQQGIEDGVPDKIRVSSMEDPLLVYQRGGSGDGESSIRRRGRCSGTPEDL